MPLHESGEDYLEAILVLHEQKGNVRSIDVAQHLGYSKPSVSRAMSILRSSGYITMERDGRILLTEAGKTAAESVYERHRFLTKWLIRLGVTPEVAAEDACRIELRSPDPAANPYLAFAAMLAAGLAGIEEGLELQPPTEDQDLFALSRQDLRRQGIQTLPESLGEAVELFAGSALMRETLGDHIHSYLVAAKRAEWNEYQGNVSAWERDRYLAVL